MPLTVTPEMELLRNAGIMSLLVANKPEEARAEVAQVSKEYEIHGINCLEIGPQDSQLAEIILNPKAMDGKGN